MTPQDITIFQVLAGLFTFSSIILVVLAVRFMLGVEAARHRLISLAEGLERSATPILDDLRIGASQFRTASERVRHSVEQVAELGDQLQRLTAFTRTGAQGVWAMLAGAVRAFIKP